MRRKKDNEEGMTGKSSNTEPAVMINGVIQDPLSTASILKNIN